jgi:hypothetical protein
MMRRFASINDLPIKGQKENFSGRLAEDQIIIQL